MALVLTEEQELLRDSAQDFVTNQWDFDWLRKVRNDKDRVGYDPQIWQQIVELGWAAIPFSEDVGGLDLGYAELGVVLEEMGRKLMVSPFLSTVVLGGGALNMGGTAEQKAAVLPGVCEGTTLLALAYQETARHDPYAIATAATADGTPTSAAVISVVRHRILQAGDSRSTTLPLPRLTGCCLRRSASAGNRRSAATSGSRARPGVCAVDERARVGAQPHFAVSELGK